MVIDNRQKHRRLRLLMKKLNQERKRQAQKIDVLCNDLISAQRNFIRKLNVISFAADFYESIIAAGELGDLLGTAARIIKTEIADVNITFFLRNDDDPSAGVKAGFELHTFESSQPIAFERQLLENCFTAELVDGICRSNAVCTLDDMFAMGLQGNLTGLNKLSAVTIPLAGKCEIPGLRPGLGFMLVYRPSQDRLTADEIDRIRSVTYGLSRAIAFCQARCRRV